MSLLAGLKPSELSDFLGANYRGESTDVRPPWLLRADNLEYEEGYIRSRRGFYEIASRPVIGNITGFEHYMLGPHSYMLTSREVAGAVNIEWAKVGDAVNTFTGRATDGMGTIFAGVGNRVYNTTYDPDYEEGTLQLLKDIDGSASLPTVWAPPVEYSYVATWTITGTFPAAGIGGGAAPGTRRLAIAFQTKSGFITRSSPVNPLTTPAYTAGILQGNAPAGTKFRLTITPDVGHPWPSYVDKVLLLATTPRNQERYYIVPGQEATVTSGTMTVVLDLDISDAALVLGTPFDEYNNSLYTGFYVANEQPIKPYYIFPCGNRLGYFFKDPDFGFGMAFSAINDYERITPDRHFRYLPQRAKPIAAKWTQGAIYIFTENATFAAVDTGDDPVTWAVEREVDGKIGTAQPHAITLDASGNGFVAHRTGLYSFRGGVYDRLPLSYYIQESKTDISWNKTNWAFGIDSLVTVADDKENYRVVATANTPGGRVCHTWSYVTGLRPDSVRYARLYHADGSVPRFCGVVQNNGDSHSSNRRQQLWTATDVGYWRAQAPADDAGGDAVIFRDTINGVNMAVQPVIWLPFLPTREESKVMENQILAVIARLRGSGTVQVSVYTTDDLMNSGVLTRTLSSGPARDLDFRFSLIAKSAQTRISLANVVGSWLEFSHFYQYWTEYSMHGRST